MGILGYFTPTSFLKILFDSSSITLFFLLLSPIEPMPFGVKDTDSSDLDVLSRCPLLGRVPTMEACEPPITTDS